MANVIDILIKANDQTSGTLSKINAAFKGLTGFSLSAAGGVAAAGVAFQKMVQYVQKSVNETVAYNSAITDQARLLGMTTEETSKLVQAGDDLFISQENLTTALRAATRQGIDVTVEGLKKLSEEYLTLNPGAERGAFLMKNFGRSGAEMGKLMEVGADGIDKAVNSIDEALIVTKKSSELTIRYKQSLDRLQDTFQGIKYTVGNEVIPVLTDFNNILGSVLDKYKSSNINLLDILGLTTLVTMGPQGLALLKVFVAEWQTLSDLTGSKFETGHAIKSLQALADEADSTSKAFISIGEAIAQSDADFAEKVGGLREAVMESQNDLSYWTAVVDRAPGMVKELQAKVDELTVAGQEDSEAYRDAKEKLEDWNNTLEHGPGYLQTLNDKLDENIEKIDKAADEHEAAANRIILSYAQQVLAADGLTQAEAEALLQTGEDMGLYAEGTVEKAQEAMTKAQDLANAISQNIADTALDAKDIISGLRDEIDGLHDKTVNITVNTITTGGSTVNIPQQNQMEAQATGGPVMGNTPYLVGEKGPEVFVPNGSGTVIPNNQLGSGSATISQSDMYYLGKIIASEIQKAIG